jgi:protein TonB
MTSLSFDTQNRLRGGAITLLVEALIGYGLILGFSIDVPGRIEEQLKIFNLAAKAPPPPLLRIKPKQLHSKKASGAASPKNIKSKATQIVAPRLPPPIPPPVIAASRPFIGDEASTGATQQRGPGTGAGGVGNGTGSGGSGNGEGDGDIGPRWKSGKIKASDFQSGMTTPGTYNVSVIYTVEVDGRATRCSARRSSGNAAFDQTVCRLIEQRYRFRAAEDSDGHPFAAQLVEDHTLTFDVEEVRGAAKDRDDTYDER